MEGISKALQGIKDGITSLINTIGNLIQNVINTILGIPKTIIDLLGEAFKLWFVPKEGYFDNPLDKLKAKFAFISDIQTVAEHFIDVVKNTANATPPTINIDLSKVDSKFNLGGNVSISFAWYAKYRNTVNNFLAGFIWLTFLWNTYKDLPNIINGVSPVSDVATKLDSGKGDLK